MPFSHLAGGRAGAGILSCIMAGFVVTACVGLPKSFELSRQYGHQPDGSFALSKWDRAVSCLKLEQALQNRLTQMARIAKAERTARAGMPPTLMEAISWNNGNPTGYGKRFKKHQMLKAEAVSYSAAMSAKPCAQKNDLRQQLAAAQMPGVAATARYMPASGPNTQTPHAGPVQDPSIAVLPGPAKPAAEPRL